MFVFALDAAISILRKSDEMAQQQLKTKQKFDEKKLFEHAKETAKLLNGTFQELTNKMWFVGKILTERINDAIKKEIWGVDAPKSAYYVIVAQQMKYSAEINTLNKCALFYNKFPDLKERIEKTGLTPTHYQELAKRDLTDGEIEHFEEKASKEDLSVSELEEILPTKRPEIALAEAIENYKAWIHSLEDLRKSFKGLQKSTIKGVLSQNQVNGMARTLWIFIHDELPKMVWFLEKHHAEIDPLFKKYVEKFKGKEYEERE